MIRELLLKLVLFGQMENNFPWNKTESDSATKPTFNGKRKYLPSGIFRSWEVLEVDKHDATIDSQMERLA